MTKQRAKNLRTELVRIAVEEMGMDQKEAKEMNMETFLDGYLIGQGMMQSWRNIALD
jgi:hypothetical protein